MSDILDTDCAVVTVRREIPISRLRDLLTLAFEGGSLYWLAFLAFRPCPVAAFSEEGTWFEDWTTGEQRSVNLLKGLDGIQAMAEKEPYAFQLFLQGEEDANTGDTYLQCCLFGETIYG